MTIYQIKNKSIHFEYTMLKRERKQREIHLESMKKEAEQKKLQAERVDRRLVNYSFIFVAYLAVLLTK